MLNRNKKSFEKIAMGLLSFMPDEKDVKKLQASIKQYETIDDWQLFLWKEEDDVIGLIGIVLDTHDAADCMIIQHLTVNPSFRYQGVGKKMIEAIQEIYSNRIIVPANSTLPFLQKCNIPFSK